MPSTLQRLDFLEKVKDFMYLRQGRMTVAEYTGRFDELAQYAPTMVAMNDAKKMKYMHGLSVEIVTQVDSSEVGTRTYAEAVQKALRIDDWKLTNKPTSTQSIA